ncbi:hypothetical protein [Sphingopyxis flava]|uniref:hypothetical protein n=1 Tax=Sphingopyxis flava TaxID=1507287 RepID=UPI001115E13C|nr:hypothetical protein [Sphingopyxis flava]
MSVPRQGERHDWRYPDASIDDLNRIRAACIEGSGNGLLRWRGNDRLHDNLALGIDGSMFLKVLLSSKSMIARACAPWFQFRIFPAAMSVSVCARPSLVISPAINAMLARRNALTAPAD